MATFIVKKTTTVTMTYRVEAETSQDADKVIRSGDTDQTQVINGPITNEVYRVSPDTGRNR
jgi:hypothetical protein